MYARYLYLCFEFLSQMRQEFGTKAGKHSTCDSQGWIKSKPKVGNSWISQVGDWDPTTCITAACLPECTAAGNCNEEWGQDHIQTTPAAS